MARPLSEFERGQVAMCQTIRKMILQRKCERENILGWCEDFLKVKDTIPEEVYPLGYNPWQE